MRKYHVLLIKQDGAWSYEFGDYSLPVVKQELEDNRAHTKKKDMKVLTCSGDTTEIIHKEIKAWTMVNP